MKSDSKSRALIAGAITLAVGVSFLALKQARVPKSNAALEARQPIMGPLDTVGLYSHSNEGTRAASAESGGNQILETAAGKAVPEDKPMVMPSFESAAEYQDSSQSSSMMSHGGVTRQTNNSRSGRGLSKAEQEFVGRLLRTESGKTAAAAGAGTEAVEAAQANAVVDAILASAGITHGPGGLVVPMARAARLKPNEPLFKPSIVSALGGRLGQGNVSMDAGSAATPANFNPKAGGLTANPGKTDPGPKIKAGKAPAIPVGHIGYILAAANAFGVDPALLAATAARESNFRREAYRPEPHLKQVSWRDAPGTPLKPFVDGSIGPTQVLRSNFKAQGIDNNVQAFDLANNYRSGARVIRSNMKYFPNNLWKAVAAYNVGKHGAEMGRVPANNYTNTILSWRVEYQKALAAYQAGR